MKLAVVAVLVLTLEVVDAICNVAGLLNFSEKTTCADGVDTSCGQEEAVAFLHVVTVDGVDNSVVLHHLSILLGCNFLLQTTEQRGVFVRIHEIPHLCLAALLALELCNLVGGMHLNGKILTRIDKLDEQRELVAETLVVVLAHEFALHLGYNLVEFLACKLAVCNDSFIVFHARNFPTFAYILLLYIEILKRNNLFAAPQCGLQQRIKL